MASERWWLENLQEQLGVWWTKQSCADLCTMVLKIKHFVPWHHVTPESIKSPLLTFWYLRRKLTIRVCVCLCACTCVCILSFFTFFVAIHCIPSWSTNQSVAFHGFRVHCIACVFSLTRLYGKNVLSAFQRWLSAAKQPPVKLCPVQSAESKLTEVNTFYNYIHRKSRWHSWTYRCRNRTLFSVNVVVLQVHL